MLPLEDGCFWMLTLGAKSATCATSKTPRSVSLLSVKAVMEIGVSCRDSSRRWAVTTISSRPPSWARAGTATPDVAAIARAMADIWNWEMEDLLRM